MKKYQFTIWKIDQNGETTTPDPFFESEIRIELFDGQEADDAAINEAKQLIEEHRPVIDCAGYFAILQTAALTDVWDKKKIY